MNSIAVRRMLGALLLSMPLARVAAAPVTGRRLPPPIVGVVRDSSGRGLSDVQVIIPSLNRMTVTDDKGGFTLAAVPAGTHHIRTLLIGFAPGHADVIVPESGPPVRVTIRMVPVGAVLLSSVQVTATPTGTDPRDVAQSTTQVAPEQLARTLSSTIAQTLSREPGVAVRFNGPAAATPVIRGLTGERVLVLQDGQRTGDLSSTSPDHALSIDPLSAERIEIVRGPASLLYGNNALGGVVNVISNELPTAIHDHLDGFVNAQAESATPGGGLSAAVTVPLASAVALTLRGQARRAEDLRMGGGVALLNSYSRNASGSLGAGYVGPTTTGGMLYRATTFDYGLPSADNEGAHIEGRRQELRGRAQLAALAGPFTSVQANGTAQWYSHDEVERTGEIGTSFNLRTQTLDLLGRTLRGRVSGALGMSALMRQYAAAGEEALTPAANTAGAGLFVFQEVPLRATTGPDVRVPRLQAGARYDLIRIVTAPVDAKFGAGRTRRFDNFSGSLGLSVPVRDGLTVALSTARAFRAPTVEELFSNAVHRAVGTYDVGNPTLVSEVNRGIDGILRMTLPRVTAQFSSYYNLIDNFITARVVGDTALADDNGTAASMPLNVYTQADATLRGVEGRLEAELFPRVVVGVMGDAVRGEFRADHLPLPYLPAARLGGLARFDDGRLTADAEYRHAFTQTRVPRAITTSDPAALATGAYDLVDVSVGYSFRAGARLNIVTLRADNLLDAQYRDATSRIKTFALNAGRNVSLGYRVTF